MDIPLIDDEEVDCMFSTSQVFHEQKALAVNNVIMITISCIRKPDLEVIKKQ